MKADSIARYVGRARRIAQLDVILAYALLTAVVLVALCIFIANPVEPFAYDKDLGFAHETAAGAVYTVHGWLDAFDAIGWTPWYNLPLFYQNSNVAEAFGLLVTWVSGNAWLAIKIVQVLQVIVSIAAGFAMYATYSRNKFWSFVFGITYAALPITALAIRGNPAMGWLAALAPAAVAGGTQLIRRFGARAVPLAGLLCGFVGLGIALEYAAFSTLPLFALIIAGERRRIRPTDWLTFVPLGLLCSLSIGAFYVIPTFVGAIVSDAAARTTTLVSGAFLGNFSETWPGLLTFVPREAYVSAFPTLNASAAIPYLYIFGAIVWAAALAHVVRTRERTGWTDYLSLSIVAICTVLAMGTAIPLGQQLWDALFSIPHLNAIRTTDRFLLVPAIFLTFWYVNALQRITSVKSSGKRKAGWLSLVIAVAFIAFDASQHCFAVDPSKGVRQPELDAVQAVVEARGGKTASFAGVNGGWSFEESSEYGVPVPTSTAAIELGWRFMEDGNGSIGVIGRTGVRTVISAPNWTNAPDFPNTATIYRRLPSAPLLFTSPENVLVSAISARPDVSSPSAVCVWGGPGAFDLLDDARGLRETAFLERTTNCRRSGFVDFDPRDVWPGYPGIEAWAGSVLIPTASPIRDNDYRFVSNRSLLKIPWYRNSIDGDRPIFDSGGAIEIAQPKAFFVPPHEAWPAGTAIALRLSSHAGGTISVFAGTANIGTVHVTAAHGLRWYQVRTTVPVSSETNVSLNMQPDAQAAGATWNGFALDGIAIHKPNVGVGPAQRNAAFVAVSLNRFKHPEDQQPNDEVFVPMNSGAGVVATNMHSEIVDQEPAWIADAPTSQIRFPWTGPPGLYVIRAQAALTKPGDTLGLDANRNGTCCSITTVNLARLPNAVVGRFSLKKGSQIVVRLASPDFESRLAQRITVVSIMRVGPLLLHPATTGGSVGGIDFSDPYGALAQILNTRGLRFQSALAYGAEGSGFEIASRLSGHPKNVSLEINKVGHGSATATLRCDGASTGAIPLGEDDTALALSGEGFTHCSTRVQWLSGDVAVQSVRLQTGGASIPRGFADIWAPAGKYRASLLEADGTVLRPPALRAAGCAVTEPICTFPLATTHRIVIGETPAQSRLLLLTSVPSIPKQPAIDVTQTAALRWKVVLKRSATVALTQIYDGNWILTDSRHAYRGERCDVTNTCFSDVPSGSYALYHSWPGPLRIGIVITALTFVVSLLSICVPVASKRSPAL